MTETIFVVATGLLVALSVFSVSYEIRKGTTMANAALQTLLASVARIGVEVGETAEAIRNHVNSDSGISASTLLEAADRLKAAADQLDGLQAELGGASGDEATGDAISDVPAGEADAPVSDGLSDAPASDVPVGDVPASDDAASNGGNQNGIGSEFETGDPADGSGLSGQDDASGLSDAPASDTDQGDDGNSDAAVGSDDQSGAGFGSGDGSDGSDRQG